ncbi:MAG TPA: hypothetical protein VGD26_14165 [Chitinophagaceae bacterium]
MAKQIEGFIVGTYDDINFYKMKGQYFARRKSSLTSKEFWTHKAFEGTRRSCSRFGRGNKLASVVYHEIPETKRKYEVFCLMKKVAIAMLKSGLGEAAVIEALRGLKPRLPSRIKQTPGPGKKVKRGKYKTSLFKTLLFRPDRPIVTTYRFSEGTYKGKHTDKIPSCKYTGHSKINVLLKMKDEKNKVAKAPP